MSQSLHLPIDDASLVQLALLPRCHGREVLDNDFHE